MPLQSLSDGDHNTDPELTAGLHVASKRTRVKNFHHETLKTLAEVIGAMGLEHTKDLRPWHIMRRTAPDTVKHYGEIFHYLQPGELLKRIFPRNTNELLLQRVPTRFDMPEADVVNQP